MKYLILALLFICNANAGTNLIMIGGGKRPAEAMQEFVRASGGEKARIIICPWASVNTQGAEVIRAELEAFHPASIEILPQMPARKKAKLASLTPINLATGIFFTGGNQNKLMKAIFDLGLKEILRWSYDRGVAFAGTSAGTAIMSSRMLTGESDLTTIDASKTILAEGLGLLPQEIIVDQHFIVRQRFNRLAGLVLNQENAYGIGIDEGTALQVINGRTARVIGPTQVLFFRKIDEKSLNVEAYSNHEMINLFNLKN